MRIFDTKCLWYFHLTWYLEHNFLKWNQQLQNCFNYTSQQKIFPLNPDPDWKKFKSWLKKKTIKLFCKMTKYNVRFWRHVRTINLKKENHWKNPVPNWGEFFLDYSQNSTSYAFVIKLASSIWDNETTPLKKTSFKTVLFSK